MGTLFNHCSLELLFVIDNSPAMTAEAVCAAIPDIVTRWGELGFTTRLSVYDITGLVCENAIIK
jgi:hypothetical protein